MVVRVGVLGTGRVGGSRAFAAAGHDVVVDLAPPAAVGVAGDTATTLAGETAIDPTDEYATPSGEGSAAGRPTEAAPEAHARKASDTTGAEHVPAPVGGGAPATTFVAGAPGARDIVESLAADRGSEVVLAGDPPAAVHLEHLARFWTHLGAEHGRGVALRLLGE